MATREFSDRERRDLESFKRMVRLIDLKRRTYLASRSLYYYIV